MISFNYGLTLLRYFSTNSVFHHFHFYTEYNFYSENYLLLGIHNNLLLNAQKDSEYL